MQSDQCVTCAHYEDSLRCKAYPGGIPEAIITGEHDHRQPFKGDNGIRWKRYTRSNPER